MKTKLLLYGLALCVGATACKALVKSLVPHVENWGSGLPKTRGSLKEGLQNGDWTYYYESGKPRAKGRYENDRQIGPWTFFYENQVVERAGEYDAQGLRTGEWTFQYEDQTPKSRGRYVADSEDGPWQFFAADGSLDRAGQFDNGKLSGPWSYYYRGGKPRAEGMYFRGDRIGSWRVHDTAGNAGNQDFGSKAGVRVAREAWANGAIRREGVLLNGAATGRWTTRHDNGKARFCCAIVDGKASGAFEARDPSGNVLAQGVFAAGAITTGTVVDASGVSRAANLGALPATTGKPWSPASELASLAPEAQIALFVAEILAPVDEQATPAPAPTPVEPQAAPLPAPAVQEVVGQIEAEPAREPAPAQPELSVAQRAKMEAFVREYIDGPAVRGSMFDSYRPAGAPPRALAQGELKQWYGQPMPFQKMKGVDGGEVDLTSYIGKKKVMIVVLRGFLGEVCCYCVAQTKALAQQRDRLEQLGVEVLVIYPGAKENEASFEKAYKQTFNEGGPPYRVFYDPNLELVSQLGIQGDLASPSTLIVDKDGKIAFFYKGEHRADRPAAKKLLEVIEKIEASK